MKESKLECSLVSVIGSFHKFLPCFCITLKAIGEKFDFDFVPNLEISLVQANDCGVKSNLCKGRFHIGQLSFENTAVPQDGLAREEKAGWC